MIISDAKIRMKKTVVKWFSTSCWFFFDEKQKKMTLANSCTSRWRNFRVSQN